jgi:diamine N-acetyltransferase
VSLEVIKEITNVQGVRHSTRVVKDSFRTVALEFGLTKSNCPTHPSNITFSQLNGLKKKGLKFFGLFLDEVQVGFVAVESNGDGLFYLEKLAVLPEYRHDGYGAALVKYGLNYALINGGTRVSIGIINEHKVLKKWYQGLGFQETGTLNLPHLPFIVGFMGKSLVS